MKLKRDYALLSSRFKKGHVPWHKGKIGVYSKETLEKMSKIKKDKPIKFWLGKHHSIKSRKLMSLSAPCRSGKNNPMYGKRGESSPNWKGGKSRIGVIIRRSFEWREWRKKIFERDNFTCKKCGNKRGSKFDGNKIILEPHHCIPIRKLLNTKFEKYIYDIRNGITLCKFCHNLIPKK